MELRCVVCRLPWPRGAAAILASVILAIAPAGASVVDPTPPQLAADYIFSPSVLIQHDSYNLVYEMRLTNYSTSASTLESIDAIAGATTFSYSGKALRNLLKPVGRPGFVGTNTIVEPGQTLLVYVTLAFSARARVPSRIVHVLHVRSADGTSHTLAVPALPVNPASPPIVAPPLRGSNWIAGDASHNGAPFDNADGTVDAAHRRTVLLNFGRAFAAQRYAIDYAQYKIVNGRGVTFSGPAAKNSSYFCYGAPIYSVARGRVVEVYDELLDNVPHQPPAYKLTFVNAGGNHVIVDIGNGRYAFYAHMQPHSIPPAIKVGTFVRAGQVLGRVGNTGSSTEPHLHFHIVNGPSFLSAQGIPYEMNAFSAGTSATLDQRPDKTTYITGFTPLEPRTDDYPQDNAPVNFSTGAPPLR
jgi:murein DD-endopeptidase MepM/ murein hydrolase activator NlpD